MHYYQFNIADYRKDTQHLTPMEHYIYRQLLDWHYLDEAPIPKNIREIIRRLRLTNDRSTDVEQVLNDFFTETDEGYTQDRVMFEINEYRSKIECAKRAGRASAKARKQKASSAKRNDRSTTVQPTINHKPITINHIPEGINAGAWLEFEQHRREMKQPLTDLARKKAMSVIEGLSHAEQADVINNTIQNRWKGLFPGKMKKPNGGDYDWRKNV